MVALVAHTWKGTSATPGAFKPKYTLAYTFIVIIFNIYDELFLWYGWPTKDA